MNVEIGVGASVKETIVVLAIVRPLTVRETVEVAVGRVVVVNEIARRTKFDCSSRSRIRRKPVTNLLGQHSAGNVYSERSASF